MSKVTGTNAIEVVGAIRENAEFLVQLLKDRPYGEVTANRILQLSRSLELLLQADARNEREECERTAKESA